jgi:hypothetical protein
MRRKVVVVIVLIRRKDRVRVCVFERNVSIWRCAVCGGECMSVCMCTFQGEEEEKMMQRDDDDVDDG